MNKIKTLFYGIFAAAGTTIFQQLILILWNIEIIDTSKLTSILIFGVFSEEIFKFLMIYKFSNEIETKKDLIFGSSFVGLGFSAVELSFKVWGNFQNIRPYFFDYFGVILVHIITSMILGYFLTLNKSLTVRIISGFTVAFLLHLIYNSLKIYGF